MTNPEHDPRVEAVAKAIYDLDPDYERDYDDSINILEWDIVGYTMDADYYRDLARAAIAALPLISQALSDRDQLTQVAQVLIENQIANLVTAFS